MTLSSSITPPPLFPKFVVHRGMTVSDQDDAPPKIRLPSQLRNAVLRRRLEFISGRLCAQEALKVLGASHFDIPIGTDRSPIWPSGFVGSITHSNGMAFAAVARTSQARGLGLDVEKIMSGDTARDVGSIFATPDEYARLLKSPRDHPLLMTIIFSAKETIFKCLYPIIRRQFDFTDVEITSIDANDGTFSFSFDASISKLLPNASRDLGRMAFVNGFVHTGLLLSRSEGEGFFL